MLRFYRQFAEQMLLALIFLRDGAGADCWESIFHHNRDRWRTLNMERYPLQTPELIETVRFTCESNEFPQTLTDMITELGAQVRAHQQQGPVSHDKDLIDTMVRVLQLPYARNRLSGDILDKLRTALLLPDELAGLRERLKREEMNCSSCGHVFRSGEMAIFLSEGRKVQFNCTNCAHPSSVAHSCGKHIVDVPNSLMKTVDKARSGVCDYCSMEATDAQARADQAALVVERPPPIAPPDTIGRIERALRNANARERIPGNTVVAYQPYQGQLRGGQPVVQAEPGRALTYEQMARQFNGRVDENAAVPENPFRVQQPGVDMVGGDIEAAGARIIEMEEWARRYNAPPPNQPTVIRGGDWGDIIVDTPTTGTTSGVFTLPAFPPNSIPDDLDDDFDEDHDYGDEDLLEEEEELEDEP